MRMPDALWGVRCVWLRYFDVFRKSLRYYLVTTFSEPILYLLSFGLGLLGLLASEALARGLRRWLGATQPGAH